MLIISLQQLIPIMITSQNIKNVIARYLNLRLKTLNASNSKLLFCDLVIFNSKRFNLVIETFSLKLTMFLKNLHDYPALPIILPSTFLFTKQSDFKKASGTKVLKSAKKFQLVLKPNNLLKALEYHIKIIS